MILDEGFAWNGTTYSSLSQVAKAITGANWNGHRFFGSAEGDRLQSRGTRPMRNDPKAARAPTLRDLHPRLHRQRPGAGFQLARQSARGVRGLHQEPGPRRLEARSATATTMAAFPAGRWTGPALQKLLDDVRRAPDRRDRRLQGRSPDPVACRLRQAGRTVRRQWGLVRLGDPGLQYDDQHGAADPQHAAVLRPVRARDHRRADSRQGRGLEEEGHLDGRGGPARLPGREPGASCRRSAKRSSCGRCSAAISSLAAWCG